MVQAPEFGRWLKERRKALDLTQDDLARLVGCATTTLRKIEAGAARPSKQIAERLADQLGVPPAERAAFVRLARIYARAEGTPATSAEPDVALIPGNLDLSGRTIKGYELRERIG